MKSLKTILAALAMTLAATAGAQTLKMEHTIRKDRYSTMP